MNLRNKIETIAGSLGVGFRYGTKYDENINADNGIFPAIILLESDNGGFNVQPMLGNVRDQDNVFLQFIDIIRMGEQADYRESTIEDMKTLAVRFINALNNTNQFQDIPENAIKWVKIADVYDANVAGIELNIPLLTDMQPRPC